MPSIKDAIQAGKDMKDFVPVPAALPVMPQMITDNRPKANPQIRCPLPPFNSDPDTLRQFEIGTQMPQIRVIPLPSSSGIAVPTAPASGAGTSSASSSSSSTSTTTLTAASINLNSGGLAAGDSFVGSVLMAKSFQLLSLSADSPCEIRIYGTSAAQSFDNGRAEGDPVAPEITSNIISCATLDELPYAWAWQNRVGVNQDTPQSTTIYVSIFNISADAVTNIAVTIAYLPLES